ncbi:MAG: UDP-3-O-(3-hydroxymyristoyl)glucosamine N-acyltransferase, partial [Pseudobdellovibrionaceae bacterium]
LCQTVNHLKAAEEAGIQTIIILEKFNRALKPEAFENFENVYSSKHFSWTLSDLLPAFQYKNSFLTTQKIHPTAVIESTAKIGSQVSIGAYSVIGKNVEIEEGAAIGPHCVIEDFVKIGFGTTLVSHVWIGTFTVIGKNCILHPFSSLGMEGFGFFTQPSGEQRHVPQIGNVVIEDQVEIKTFVAIDRSTLGTTLIKRGTKFDNHCHIGHNCEIGENALLAGGFMMAGSSKIGNQFVAGGGTLVSDHVKITDHVMLGGKSGVIKDISTKGIYGGYPLQPFRESLKSLANIAELTKMRKQIAQVMKHLGLSSSDAKDEKGDAHGS